MASEPCLLSRLLSHSLSRYLSGFRVALSIDTLVSFMGQLIRTTTKTTMLKTLNWWTLDDENNVVGPVDFMDGAQWVHDNTERRIVKKESFTQGDHSVEVSTVFLGLDHSWDDGGAPLVFETMVFGGPRDGDCLRCSTWEEALDQHEKVASKVLGIGELLGEDDPFPEYNLTNEQRQLLTEEETTDG